MKVSYTAPKNINVKSVKIIWKDKAFPDRYMMRTEKEWVVDIDIPNGNYYYRFVINDVVTVNDPVSDVVIPQNDTKLWSLMYMNQNGERQYYGTQNSIELSNYSMSNRVTQYDEVNVLDKKVFNMFLDEVVSIRYDFTHVVGNFMLTLVWINPDGEVFDTSESCIYEDKEDQDDIASVWFNMHLKNEEYDFALGVWKVVLFINGTCVTEEYFQLGKSSIYTNYGKYIMN